MEDKALTPEKIAQKMQRRLARFSETSILDLAPQQVTPARGQLKIEDLLPPREPLIQLKTPIASMGSCFAREIKDYLQARSYNYLSRGEGAALRHGSAPWERVFNTGCIRQEVCRGFGLFQPDILQMPNGKVLDPHRKNTAYRSVEEAKDRSLKDATAAGEVLSEAKVFVLTLGLSETWYDRNTHKFFAEAPPVGAFDSTRHAFRLLSPAENASNLSEALDVLKAHNPNIQVILTVSPIPLRATVLKRSAIVSNVVSKASLIWAAHEIVSAYSWVHYFPSYEIVTVAIGDPYEWDCRHVTRETVATVMQAFEKSFIF